MTIEIEKQKGKKGKGRLILIILMVIILLASLAVAYFILTDHKISDAMNAFQEEEEYTLVLDDFVVNLVGEGNMTSKNYLKVQVALMYTDKKNEKVLSGNISKIRDSIIENLRYNSALDLASAENIEKVKDKICKDVNKTLNEEIVQEIFFSDLLIQ
ncbi:MAG: flagellar basal body-associated FliL family protein [Eubacteriales bacterium]